MLKKGVDRLSDKKARMNSWLFVVLVIVISAFLSVYVRSLGWIAFGGIGNSNLTNYSTGSIQINCTPFIPAANATQYNITNVTINVTATGRPPKTMFTFNISNGSTNIGSGSTAIFNLSLSEGVYNVNCSFGVNGSMQSNFNGLDDTTAGSIANVTTNLTIVIDLSSPIINETNSNNITYNSNRTGNTINITITAYDLMSNVKNITLFKNGTVVATKLIDSNATTTINYTIRGTDINDVFNFTINVTDFVGRSNSTDGMAVFVTQDGTPVGPIELNYSNMAIINQTGSLFSFNFTAYDNNDTAFTCELNVTMGGSNFSSVRGISVINATTNVTTLNIFSNGTYTWAVNCSDTAGNLNSSVSNTFIIDNIGPVFSYYNFTNSSVFNALNGAGAIAVNTSDDGGNSRVQGRLDLNNTASRRSSATIFAASNWTDNLTIAFMGALQFFNVSIPGWQTLNTTTINNTGEAKNGGWVNLSFFIPGGHNEFEGKNVSFRVIANDTLGNVNNSNSVKNFTILVNDTTGPALNITATIGINNTNISSTTISAGWSILTEPNSLSEINITIDGNYQNNADGCNKSARFITTAGPNNVERQRNGTMLMSTDPTCVLGNGTHFIEIIAKDNWGNIQVAFHNFTVESGSAPIITLTNLSNLLGRNITNQSNITRYTGINITAVDGTTGRMKNLSFVSSCNSSVTMFDGDTFNGTMNRSFIYPFNYSTCRDVNSQANRTVTVTAYDFSGNSAEATFGFLVDDLGPQLTVNYPQDGVSVSGINITFNISAQDGSQKVASVGYYIDDGIAQGIFNSLNLSAGLGGAATNITIETSRNISGTHTIKFTVNDTLGNRMNSSVITFTQAGAVNMSGKMLSINNSINRGNSNTSNVSILDSNGNVLDSPSGADIDQTLQLFVALNTSNGINVTFNFNGSSANWNKTDEIYMIINETNILRHILNNQTANIINSLLINRSITQYLSANNSYFGKVRFSSNINASELGGRQQLWYFPDETNMRSKTNITQCPADLTLSHSLTTGLPCWNATTRGNRSVDIFVPHFSVIAAVNDTNAPTVNLTTPAFNQTESMFIPNITVSADAVSCKYILNGSTTNQTMTLSNNVCIGQNERLLNMLIGDAYQINFTVTDSVGNVNTYIVNFNVNDTTAPNSPNSSVVSTSVSSTTATITLSGLNESVNVNVSYGTAIGTLTSQALETDFNESQSVSLSILTASTQYFFNVTICDYNNNCARNGTFNFTTSAAASSTTSATTSSTTSAGSGGAAVAETNVVASSTKSWSVVTPSAPAVMTVTKADVGISEIAVSVKSEVKNIELKVEALKTNPISEAAAPKVYQYIQITKSGLQNTDIEKATVKFKVPKSWLSSNNVGEDSVALYRYDGKWQQLSTTKASSDSSFVYYEAITTGFSTFAIGTKEAPAVTTTTTTTTTTPAVTTTTIPRIAPGVPGPVITTPGGQIPVLLIIIILVIVGLLIYFWYMKKKAK